MENSDIEKIKAFLEEIAVIVPSDMEEDGQIYLLKGHVYLSKYDDSYLTRVGMEEDVKFLMDLGITEEIQSVEGDVAQIGYSPSENKWYGWSHRAVFGFTIGSECKKGHIHYFPNNEVDWIEAEIQFWSDEYKKVTTEKTMDQDGHWGILMTYHYNDTVPNKKLRNSISTSFRRMPTEWGRGEWTAKTMKDAKQMAIDFAKGIS